MTVTLPAEWAPQSCIQLTWPRSDGDFAPWFPRVEACFRALAVAITRYQPLLIATPGDAATLTAQLVEAGVAADRLRVVPVQANDVWARDHGPITVFREGRRLHLDFTFNGWGGKFDARLDNTVTQQLAAAGALPAAVETLDFVLEGGGIESDGQGTLLTTERCLLAPTRNPKLSRNVIEQKLAHWFGLNRILWLKHGDLLGDDTDGHIDTLARFCDPQTIAYQACNERDDPHYEDLAAMAAELRAFKQVNGTPYRLIPLPMAPVIVDEDGRRLPAGYANFLILNGAVLVPTYGDASRDAAALAALKPAFADREVVGVDCLPLIHQYGSLHCVTMQIPAEPSA
jgi:agmatine/peptidylarginine deiminase